MIQLKEIKKHIKKDFDLLLKNVQAVRPLDDKFEISFKFADLGKKEKVDTLLEAITGQVKSVPGRYLYIFEAKRGANSGHIFKSYEKTKNQKPQIALARINKVDSKLSNVLYVGSSKTLVSRMRQHFGLGPQKTYALHMSQWAKGIQGSFRIRLMCFDQNIDDDVLQVIEDMYSKVLCPIFGRRGSL